MSKDRWKQTIPTVKPIGQGPDQQPQFDHSHVPRRGIPRNMRACPQQRGEQGNAPPWHPPSQPHIGQPSVHQLFIDPRRQTSCDRYSPRPGAAREYLVDRLLRKCTTQELHHRYNQQSEPYLNRCKHDPKPNFTPKYQPRSPIGPSRCPPPLAHAQRPSNPYNPCSEGRQPVQQTLQCSVHRTPLDPSRQPDHQPEQQRGGR